MAKKPHSNRDSAPNVGKMNPQKRRAEIHNLSWLPGIPSYPTLDGEHKTGKSKQRMTGQDRTGVDSMKPNMTEHIKLEQDRPPKDKASRVLHCPVLSCPICPALCCTALLCPFLCCPVLSCPVLSLLSCLVLPCSFVMSSMRFVSDRLSCRTCLSGCPCACMSHSPSVPLSVHLPDVSPWACLPVCASLSI